MRDLKSFRAGITVRQQSDYSCFSPSPLPPENLVFSPKTVKLLSQANRNLGRLDGIGETLPGRDTFISMYVQKESVLSSQIEGTQASLTDVLLETETKEKDIEEVVSYTKALNYGIQRLESLPMSLRLIKELHRELMNNSRGHDKNPGEFRHSQNWIGSLGSTLSTATFIPPSPTLMNQCLYDLERFMHQEDDIPSLVKIALIHYQFETIHPFLDGNGRLGRLLIALWLYSKDILRNPLLYLSYYFKSHREEYYDHLMKVRIEGDYESWIDFFLEGVIRMSEESTKSIMEILQLKELHRGLLVGSSIKNHSQAIQVLEGLFRQPYITSKHILEWTGVSKPTANKILTEFVSLGILTVDPRQKRYRRYAYKAYLDLLETGTEL